MTAKADNGEGSCYFLASRKRWMTSFTDLDGKRKTRVAKPNTERGAQSQLRKALTARDAGETMDRGITVAGFLEPWLETRRVAGRRPRTIEAYRERVTKHILPSLGATRLDKITPVALDRLYAKLLASGLSPSTVAHVHDTLRAMLYVARRRRLVGHVVTSLVEPPRAAAYTARTLTIAEARTLLDAIRDHRHGPLWTFMLGTGCRFGEAAGLTWHNVDAIAATALICQQVTRERDTTKTNKQGRAVMRHVLANVKTDAGRRELQLPSFVVAALHRQHAIVVAMRQIADVSAATRPSSRWRDTHPDIVFPSHRGTLLQENHVLRDWHAMLATCGLEGQGQPPLRMHDLRHTKGTLMADSGEDTTTIQRTLGHARQSITADIYIGRTTNAQRNAADRYGALFDAPTSRHHVEEATQP